MNIPQNLLQKTPMPATPTLAKLSRLCELCEDVGYRGWKTPVAGYSLADCTFCDCEAGQRALAFWQHKEAEAHQRKLNGLFAGAGIPAHFRDFTVETMIERAGNDPAKRAAIEAVLQFIGGGVVLDPVTNRYKSGIILQGHYGCGKTGLLTPALRSVLGQGKSGLWIEVYDFIGAVQQGYNDGDSSAKLQAAQRADVVLLDDLGDAERVKPETDDRRRILYELINYRHNNACPMLITTNCSAPQLAQQLGARTIERVFESCAWIEMGGRNLRME